MSNETDSVTKRDGDNVANEETNETKETQVKEPKSVSFDKDVHIKRFGKPRESRSSSTEPSTRKEPFTHLSEQELIEEANKVRAQAESVTCTADHPPEKFYSLPHRRKVKEQEKLDRRNSDESAAEKKQLGRSASDVTGRKRRERTSLSTLFRKAQKTKTPEVTVKVVKKPVTVKRSKSDVSDLKSNTNLNIQPKPIRKRSGSETEEFLKSLRNKKAQLSPIIENSPRDDYFRKTPPLEAFQKKLEQAKGSRGAETKQEVKIEHIVNPIEKPPRYKSPEKEPKPPVRRKRGKSLEKELEESQPITETPKRKTEVKKSVLVDEIDSIRSKDIHPIDVKNKIKESIRKIEENVYGSRDMIHSSQKPPEKPPLTRGHTVSPIVRQLREDSVSPTSPKSHVLYNSNGNQPFSYTKPSVSPDPNLFTRNISPERVSTPVNKMDRGVVYAQVVRDNGENGNNTFKKQTVHKTYSPSREKYGNLSDEDEGLGYEDRHKTSPIHKYEYEFKNRKEDNYNKYDAYKITDSPIKPRYREYKLTSFEDFEPTYANGYATKDSRDYVDGTLRGRADGMDTRGKSYDETDHIKADLDFNELSHRRQLLESRLNARKYEPHRPVVDGPVSRYLAEKDPIYEANKRMKATEKYVNETARYYRETLERDGYVEDSVNEDYNKYDSDDKKIKYNNETRTFEKVPKGELDRREYLDRLGTDIFKDEPVSFPPEPEYEPPSLEVGKPTLSADEYVEKKYRVRTKHVTSSHDVLTSGKKYKNDDKLDKKRDYYASNPEIVQDKDEDYANTRYESDDKQTYHNSLRREKIRDKHHTDYTIRRHDSGDSRDYRDDRSPPRRFDFDSRLVDSGIENDFRKDSGELHKSRYRRPESDDDVRDTSMFLANERQHTEDTYPSEQVYVNGEYVARFGSSKKDSDSKERSADEGSHLEPKRGSFEKSPSRNDEKISSKPPKSTTKKLSGLEKVKQLFSRDSSKKSKKQSESPQRTRVLASPEHDSQYKRYRDPEPGDDGPKDYRSSREDLDRYRSSDPQDSDPERKYRDPRTKVEHYEQDRHSQTRYRGKERTYREEHREERRRYGSSDRESDRRTSDVEREMARKSRSKTNDHLDSPALAQRYRDRRRLATPSPTPTPSPPRRSAAPAPTANTAGNWFKSLDRLTKRKTKTSASVEKETGNATTEEESPRAWSSSKKQNTPPKNLRFFGDTDVESDTNTRHATRGHQTLRKTVSNSSTGPDEPDRAKSYSLSNLHKEERHFRRLHNISEHHNSDSESRYNRKMDTKPPIPVDRRSRSQSSSKTLKERRHGSRTELADDRGSSTELRGSKQELRDVKQRRRAAGQQSGESSTEGESSHPSQRSVVFLHATTVGDIPDPGVLARNRSRDDVSSVNSSNLQVRTTQKSFSLFAPWTPRHYNDPHEVNYAQRPRKARENLHKTSSNRNLTDERPGTLQKKKSYSQTTLTRRPQTSRLSNSSTTLNRKPEKRRENDSVISATLSRNRNKKSQSSEVLNRDGDRDRISRSISMPKDKNKKAGWFNLSKNKKQQESINSRVR